MALVLVLYDVKQPAAPWSTSFARSPTQYALVENVILAIVFACDKFRQYIYGKNDDMWWSKQIINL